VHAGADLNIQNNLGETALHCAIKNPQLIKLLLEFGANPKIKNKFNKTPKYYAIHWSCQDLLTNAINEQQKIARNQLLFKKLLLQHRLISFHAKYTAYSQIHYILSMLRK